MEQQRARPWLDVRMPRYASAEIEPLIGAFSQDEGIDLGEASAANVRVDLEQQSAGRELAGRSGLNCIGCHDFGDHAPVGGVRAPDLATTTLRLQFDWFRRWLHDPQSITPGTRMPTCFRNGRSAAPTVLDGSEAAQVAALWAYLSRPDRQPPWGLATGELIAGRGETDSPVPTDRPLLLHNIKRRYR